MGLLIGGRRLKFRTFMYFPYRMTQPAIRSYDKMFEVDEEERLSGEREERDGEGLTTNQHHLGDPGAPTP